MARYQRIVINYPANDVWAAAAAAQRINGSYIKMTHEDTPGIETNRDIVYQLLKDSSPVTDADRTAGDAARTYYKGLTFKILQGKKLSDFDNTALSIANRDVITGVYDIAIITSLPSCYERGAARDKNDNRLNQAKGFVGSIGDKVTLTIEVMKSTYSQNYGIYFITGLTDGNESVFFALKNGMERGDGVKVSGTVKAHRVDSTQLNRVKVL